MMKQILFINHSFRAFDHFDSGASNRSAMFIQALANVGHVDVISFLEGEVSNIENCSVVYSKPVEPIKHQGRLSKMMQLFAAHRPYLVYPLNAQKQSIIEQQLKTKHYDFIAIRYISQAIECGLLKYANQLILDIDDNPRDALLMQVKHAKTLRNKVFSYIFANVLDKMVRNTLQYVFCCFHSNPYQAPIPSSIYLHNVTVCSNSLPDITDDTPLQILVVGLYHYGPNKQGVDHFLHHVFPLVRKKNKKITLHIVGRIPNEEFFTAWSSVDGVQVMGFVPDLSDEYQSARMVVVPIYSGSGTSVKVIEAMRMNRACIATPQGMRGYNQLQSGKDYLLAQDDITFAKQILQYVANPIACNELAHNASQKVEQYYSTSAFCKIVYDAINKI